MVRTMIVHIVAIYDWLWKKYSIDLGPAMDSIQERLNMIIESMNLYTIWGLELLDLSQILRVNVSSPILKTDYAKVW